MDGAVAQFELALEAVLALEDDADALEHIFHGLQRMRACAVKLEDAAVFRIRKIRNHVQPELRRLMTEADTNLTIATLERAATRAKQRAVASAEDAR